jgi:homocysteine S-methyltransferase
MAKSSSSSGSTRTQHQVQVSLFLLDGGNGHELKQRGVITDGSFAAGVLANETSPSIVQAVHSDFLHAGCRILTTNSFVAVPSRMMESGEATSEETSNQRAQQLIRASVKCARAAATAATTDNNDDNDSGQDSTKSTNIRIAGCVPPLTECYIADKVPQDAGVLESSYEVIISTLLSERVDLLLAETLSTIREARAIIRVLKQQQHNIISENLPSIPLWLSFTVKDDCPTQLRSGESLIKALNMCISESAADDNNNNQQINLDAIGVNCSSPKAISAAVPLLVTATNEYQYNSKISKPPRVLAYANAFQTTTSEWLQDDCSTIVQPPSTTQNDDITCSHYSSGTRMDVTAGHLDDDDGDYDEHGCILPEVYAKYAQKWVQDGATIVGGCCGCTPRHMRAVAEAYLQIS